MRLLSAALHAAANGIVITDRDGTIEWVNPAFTRMTGYSSAEAVGRNPRDLLRSGQHEAAFYRDLWETILRGDVWRGRTINRRKDGSIYHEDQTITPVLDDRGAITHFVAVKQDVTRQQETTDRLRFQAQLLDAVGDAIIATDLDGRIRYWGLGAERLYGWSRDGVLGKNVRDIMTTSLSRAQAEEIMTGLAAGEGWSGEFEVRRRDGSVLHVHSTDSPLRDDSGRLIGIVGVSRDLTRHRSLEQQLRQSQKMDAVGRLAGGIAHDLNNVLTAVLGHNQLVMDRLEPGPVRDDANQVRVDAERAGRLVQKILAFSRRQMLQPVVLELAALVRGIERMLRPGVREDITLVVDMADPGRVEADPVQIEQVVLNLAINAMDAMADGGTLSITLERMEVGEGEVTGQEGGLRPGRYVVLQVADTGHGMDAATIERIFDPFFTTRPPGAGTGLGLSTAYGVVRQAGGQITVTSEPGRGATFRVYLPLTGAPLSVAEDAAAQELVAGQGATVLLVEDDDSVRSLVRRVLERAGFEVVEADSPDAALTALDNPAVDLLITDVIMPGMSGVELAGRVAEVRPGIPVLFMSGYAEAEILLPGHLPPGHRFVPKPFTPDQLLRAVAIVLASA